ncbi:hypothetical protein KR009_003428 [Drosophila setifemur]|nr:hypothetical protein KR009_003428 [Drosophila setifemur]
MAGKRQATTNLTHDNWDHEEEPEERGTFRTATEDELKTRVIKKARRKDAGASASTAPRESTEEAPAESRSIFSGFSGFSKPAPSTAVRSPFAFLAKIPPASATDAPATAATTSTKSDAAKPFSIVGSSSSTAKKPCTSFFGSSSSTTEGAITKASSSIFGTTSASKTDGNPKPETTSIFGSISKNTTVGATTKGSAPVFGSTTKGATDAAIPKTAFPIVGNISAAKKGTGETSSSSTAGSSSSSNSKPANASEFRESVAELNRALVVFLKEHIDKNPYCILSPVFKSYEKHLMELRAESATTKDSKKTPPTLPTLPTFSPPSGVAAPFSLGAGSKDPPAFSFGKPSTPIGGTTSLFGKKPNCTVTSGGTTTTTTAPMFAPSTSSSTSFGGFGSMPAGEVKTDEAPKAGFFSFGTTKKDEPVASPPKTNGFSFGLKSAGDNKPASSMFTGFGKPAEGAGDSKLSTGFSFTPSATPFSFGNIKPPAAAAPPATSQDGEEEEDKPPKVEFKQVVEDDAVFSKRCKVFVKKDKDFGDRGVGTLYLKPVKDSEKTQMLVRADTNLGNILVNIILTEGIPCQRMGKNNVMLVCVPTPEQSTATSMLLRVKTAEEADELLEQIKKHIK